MNEKTKIRYKYKDLKAELLAQIHSGILVNGGRLESEPKLAERLHLSRNTIRQALRELEEEGYVYRVHGQGTFLRNSAPKELNKSALLIYDTAYMAHPVTGGLIRGIDEILKKNGFFLDVLASSRSFQDENLKNLAERYAGFLIGTHQLDELTLGELSKIRRPYLFVKNYPPDREAPATRIDFQKAGFLAVTHLAEIGCRNLALLCPGKGIAIADDFREGVRSAALEYGLKLRGENSFPVDFSDLDAIPDICGELLAHDERVDGVVCASDDLACALLAELKKRKVPVPEQIAVVGCNNTDNAKTASPPLTTIDIPVMELGRRAADVLLGMIRGESVTMGMLEPSLVVRNSTKRKHGE